MSLVFAAILGVVQGIAEFLPISSSGHLVVFQQLLGSSFDSKHVPLSFDVFLHLSTLLVALWFLRADIVFVLANLFRNLDENSKRARSLTLLVCVATLPAVVFVLLFQDTIDAGFSSVWICGWGFIATSCILFFADYKKVSFSRNNEIEKEAIYWNLPTLSQAFIIGCAQAFAIMPGVSRSGSTIAMALILGLSATSAIRFSFLMFIPAVLGASVKELGELSSISQADFSAYLLGFAVAGIVGVFSLKFLTLLVNKAKLGVFGVYTLILGSILLFNF